MNPRIAAFFDLDNTIVPGPAIEHPYFRLLWRRGLVGPKDLLRSVGVLLRETPPFTFDPLRRYKGYLAGPPPPVARGPALGFFPGQGRPRVRGRSGVAGACLQARSVGAGILTPLRGSC